jgi:hypothetical protein
VCTFKQTGEKVIWCAGRLPTCRYLTNCFKYNNRLNTVLLFQYDWRKVMQHVILNVPTVAGLKPSPSSQKTTDRLRLFPDSRNQHQDKITRAVRWSQQQTRPRWRPVEEYVTNRKGTLVPVLGPVFAKMSIDSNFVETNQRLRFNKTMSDTPTQRSQGSLWLLSQLWNDHNLADS